MPLSLYVDGPRWHRHLRGVLEANPGLVPVLKGNGYGLGLPRLAEASAALGVDTVAVGTYDEVAPVAAAFLDPAHGDRSVLVLTPWRPHEPDAPMEPYVVHTVGRLEDLAALADHAGRTAAAPPRVVLERMTSMRRHGFSARELREAADRLGGVRVEGVALHLPMTRGSHGPEMARLMNDVVAAGLPTRRVYVSHLSAGELAELRQGFGDYEIRPRVGTSLWLGDRDALAVRATVLDAHPVERGDVFGYRGRAVPAAGTILVVSGGTTHGIGLEAPTGGASLRDRAVRLAGGALDAAGFVRSPYTVDGKPRLFAEPPHMQASMLFLPSGVTVPEVGAEVPVRVRFTTTTVDHTVVVG